MRKLTADEVSFSVTIEPEDLPVRGNYMCTDDPEQDRADENELIERLDRGDHSAWCCLKVTASWLDFEGTAYLGGCSFAPSCPESPLQNEMEEMAEQHGMPMDALADLNDQIIEQLERAEQIAQKLKGY